MTITFRDQQCLFCLLYDWWRIHPCIIGGYPRYVPFHTSHNTIGSCSLDCILVLISPGFERANWNERLDIPKKAFMQAPAPCKLNSRSAKYDQFLFQPISTCTRIQYLQQQQKNSKLQMEVKIQPPTQTSTVLLKEPFETDIIWIQVELTSAYRYSPVTAHHL